MKIFMSAFLLIIIITGVLSVDAFASQRLVVNELFTNTRCHSARAANLYMDSLEAVFPDYFITVRYHVGFPDIHNPFYNYIPEEIDAKRYYYIIGALPEMPIDGVKGGPNYRSWAHKIAQRYQVPSNLEMSISGYHSFPERRGVLYITVIGSEPVTRSNLFLRTVAFEDDAYYADPDSLFWHSNVVYDFIPNTQGETVVISQDDTLRFMELFYVPDFSIQSNVGFAAFVQDDDTHEILQGVKSVIWDLQTSPAGLGLEVPACPIIIPYRGGLIEYCAYAENYLNISKNYNIWTVVVFPDGERQVELNIGDLKLKAGGTFVNLKVSQWIPGCAPTGLYKFYAYIGVFPDSAYTWDMTEFLKTNFSWKVLPEVQIPENHETFDIYPNPFNTSTSIIYNLDYPSNVRIDIYNIRGRKLTTLVNEIQAVGLKNLIWSGIDFDGIPVASGVYFCRLEIEDRIEVRKIIFQR